MAEKSSIKSPEELKRELQDILNNHANPFMKRWKALRADGRKDLILRVCPGMQNFAYEIIISTERPLSEHAVYLPWLACTRLANDDRGLLRLLHVRTAFSAGDWDDYDYRQVESWRGVPRIEEFDRATLDALDRGEQHLKPRQFLNDIRGGMGFRVAHSQWMLLKFLHDVTELVYPASSRQLVPGMSKKWEKLIESGFCRHDEQDLSFAGNQAYTAPLNFDLEDMETLCTTHLELAQDDIWLRQTNIPFIKNMIRSLLGVDFQHPALDHLDSSDPYTAIADIIFIVPTKRLTLWHCILQEFRYMKKVYETCTEAPPHQPAQFAQAWTAFELLLRFCMRSKKRLLQRAIHENPVMKERLKLYGKDRLVTLLSDITVDFDSEPIQGAAINDLILFTQIEELWAKICPLLDQQQADILADMTAIYELLVRLRSFHPSFERMDMKEVINRQGGRVTIKLPELALQRESWRHILSWITVHDLNYPGGELAIEASKSIGPCLRKFMESPSKEVTSRAFAEFWLELQRYHQTVLKGLGHTDEDITAELKRISYDDNSDSTRKLQQREISPPEHRPLSENLHQPRQKSVAELEILESCRTKKVSKHAKSLPGEAETLPIPTNRMPEFPRKPIFVHHNNYSIFERMWPSSPELRSQSTAWTEFTRAMSDAGFRIQNKGGSAVSFRQDGKTIVIHKPHPDPKLSNIEMQNIGERLTKWMNLELENFHVSM